FLYPMARAERRAVLQYIGRIVGALLIFDIILEWAEFSVPLWYGIGEEIETLRLILFGPYWWMFWVVHLLIGTAIPLALIFFGKRSWQRGIAGLLIATTFLAVRLNLVIPEQLTPPLHQLRESFVDRRLQFEYVPSLHEWLVVVFLVATGATVIYLANLLLHRWGLLHAPTEEATS
ncbi:MAG: NrfD/PsrC family molybdoenzyme membrane anchor subunit, partial [Fimbriimonadales bacterium]